MHSGGHASEVRFVRGGLSRGFFCEAKRQGTVTCVLVYKLCFRDFLQQNVSKNSIKTRNLETFRPTHRTVPCVPQLPGVRYFRINRPLYHCHQVRLSLFWEAIDWFFHLLLQMFPHKTHLTHSSRGLIHNLHFPFREYY